jgi:hypothetical protein
MILSYFSLESEKANLMYYEKVVWVARIMTIAAPILAVLYSLIIGLVATIKHFSVPVGGFQGATIILFPVLLAIGFIGWKWALLGGIAVIVIGLSLLFPMLAAAGWPDRKSVV